MRNFWRRLFGGETGDRGLYLYVRCGRCGAPVRVRIDPANDLAAEYGADAITGYRLVKEIMDDRCFRLMRAELTFDRGRRELERTISGGEFITAAEYERLRDAAVGAPAGASGDQ